jgi:hypothetical protein
MLAAILRAFDRIIPAEVQALPDALRAARHLALLGAVAALSAPLLALMYHLLAFDAAGAVVLSGGLVMALAPFFLKAGASLPVARDLLIGALFLLKIWLAIHLGGLAASTVPWFALCPMIAVLIGGTRPGLIWGGVVLATMGALFAFERMHGGFIAHPVADLQVVELVSHVGLIALSTIIALCFRAEQETPRGAR